MPDAIEVDPLGATRQPDAAAATPVPEPVTKADAVVTVRDVRQEFEGGVVALDGFDLEVSRGEFLAILGPSGCGKSTLLRLIAGLETPTAGRVSVTYGARGDRVGAALAAVGGAVSETTAAKAAPTAAFTGAHEAPKTPATPRLRRADVAFVFQDAHLLPWRNVLHNVALPLELLHVPRRQRLAASARAIEKVGLTDAATRYPNQLSGGMRMRVSLARAMVTDPDLLLLDEPFAALDEITRQHLDEQLRQLWAERGMTVIFVTHSTAEATFLADRAVVMSRRPGRVVLDRAVGLPSCRDGPLRATPAFARETRFLYEALERGGA